MRIERTDWHLTLVGRVADRIEAKRKVRSTLKPVDKTNFPSLANGEVEGQATVPGTDEALAHNERRADETTVHVADHKVRHSSREVVGGHEGVDIGDEV